MFSTAQELSDDLSNTLNWESLSRGQNEDPLKHGGSEVEATGRFASYITTLHLIIFKNINF